MAYHHPTPPHWSDWLYLFYPVFFVWATIHSICPETADLLLWASKVLLVLPVAVGLGWFIFALIRSLTKE